MERAHIFFESFDSFMEWRSLERPLFVIQLQTTEPTGVSGLTRITHVIHLSQVQSETIHHCLMRISTHIEPVEQHEREANRQYADRAWALMTALVCERHENYCVNGASCAYPNDITKIYAGLPRDIIVTLTQEGGAA